MSCPIHVQTDRSFTPAEYAELMAAMRWGDVDDYSSSRVATALASYHFVGHVRDDGDTLVGYVCAFSDDVFATFVGELVVHPSQRATGIGAALLGAVEIAFPAAPVFALGFRDMRGFFARQGYSEPPRPMDVLTKLTTWPSTDGIVMQSTADA